MKYLKIPAMLALVCLTSCLFSPKDDDDDNNGNCLTGSGATITETPDIGYFHSVAVGIEGNLNITQGTPAYLSIETHPNVMDELQVEVRDQVLEIDFDRCTSNIEKLEIDVTMPDINTIVFSGVGDLNGVNDFELDDLTIVLSGVGNITLSGEVDNLTCVLSGVGNLYAFDLETSHCTLTISGLVDAEITVNDQLDVVISGSGVVYYKGSPSVTSSISGTGSIVDSN